MQQEKPAVSIRVSAARQGAIGYGEAQEKLMRLTAIVLVLLTLSSLVRAREAGSPATVPSAPQPPPLPTSPSSVAQEAAEDLIQRGHTKKVAGGTLILIGSLASIAGSVMLIADAVKTGNCGQFHTIDNCSHGDIYSGGIALDLIAIPIIGAGIITYVLGGSQMARGQRMQSGGAQADNALVRF
jgi:hypothetical protein